METMWESETSKAERRQRMRQEIDEARWEGIVERNFENLQEMSTEFNEAGNEDPASRLMKALNAYSLGNELAKVAFLKIIDDVNCGKISPEKFIWAESPGDASQHKRMQKVSTLYEILLTIRDYDLLLAVFECKYFPTAEAQKYAALKKAVRLADDRLINFLVTYNKNLQNIDKKSMYFSLMKGIQRSGKKNLQNGWNACARIFRQMYTNPETDLVLLSESLEPALRRPYLAPRQMLSVSRAVRENTYLIQFLRCQPNLQFRVLDLNPLFLSCVQYVHILESWRAKAEYTDRKSDIRVTPREFLPSDMDSLMDTSVIEDEVFILVDLLVTGGVLPGDGEYNLAEEKSVQLQSWIRQGLTTKEVCEIYLTNPALYSREWVASGPARNIGSDIVSLIFEFLGAFLE